VGDDGKRAEKNQRELHFKNDFDLSAIVFSFVRNAEANLSSLEASHM